MPASKQPANSAIKPSRPMSLQQSVAWRFKACKKCGGDVCEDYANQETQCIQCGFDQQVRRVSA